ncbi:hypothetical protein ACIP4W_40140 [Streptomyces sp. NPDC088846]|uniref:hypothetical protein n=1 Tax=Streptomyces sp. NPDC088846 TaxID=3365908 RepID=UPI003800D45F
MIVLHGYRLVYVRTRKTGSTSLEIALSRLAGPDDIVTALSPRDEALRREAGGRPPQNHFHPGLVPGPGPVAQGIAGRVRFHNHMPACHIRAELGDQWDRYVTFTVERSPYDKVTSLYFHQYRDPSDRPPIDYFIETGEFADALNWPLYTDTGSRVIVDHVLRDEALDDGFDQLVAAGLPDLDLPRAKAHFRPPHSHYRDVLTSAARRAIEAVYAPEFEMHGYGLGDDPTLDRFDDAARALALARGPIGSADLVTVLAAQVATLASIIAGPHGDPEPMYTALIRDQVDHARQQRDAQQSVSD